MNVQTIKAPPARIRELASEGHSQATIAAILGVTRERIRQICDRDGIETLPGHVDWDRRDKLAALVGTKMTAKEAARLAGYKGGADTFRYAGLEPPRKEINADHYRKCAEAGMTLTETARHFGKTTQQVWNEAHRVNPPVVFAGLRGPQRIVGREIHAEVLSRYEAGESAKVLAAAFNVTPAGIYMALCRARKYRASQVSA